MSQSLPNQDVHAPKGASRTQDLARSRLPVSFAGQCLQAPLNPAEPPGALHQGIDTEEPEESQDNLPLGNCHSKDRRFQGHQHCRCYQDDWDDRIESQHAAQVSLRRW
jgi:hypothetical protein